MPKLTRLRFSTHGAQVVVSMSTIPEAIFDVSSTLLVLMNAISVEESMNVPLSNHQQADCTVFYELSRNRPSYQIVNIMSGDSAPWSHSDRLNLL